MQQGFRRAGLPVVLLMLTFQLFHASDAHAQFFSPSLDEGPWTIQTYQARIQVSVLARGLEHPWSLAFLPDGDILITERAGRLRLLRQGELQAQPVPGAPVVHAVGLTGLMEVLPHPDFEGNGYVYLTYSKKLSDDPLQVATTLARGRFNGEALVEVEDLLSTDTWNGAGGAAARLVFGPDGKLYMTTGATRDESPQDPGSLRGKILRLNDDGSVPDDNPFIGREGYRPEIFTLGHRNPAGIAVNPITREIWSSEYGPNGGDELNIIKAGKNYGWPLVSFGRDYSGPFISPLTSMEGMERPVSTFIPGISPSGLAFYTGTDFPTWTTSAFVGASRVGQIPGTGRLVRIFYDENGNERHREDLLTELGQRIRDVQMGPDGRLYLLTEEQDGALLVIGPPRE
ncbi:MAG: PQQ-dependent sugar dehydrogenase [Pseudohongiellaceae bacterium]